MVNSVAINNTVFNPFVKQNKAFELVSNPETTQIYNEIIDYKAQIADKFEYSSSNSSENTVFKASDGKNYNLTNAIFERLNNVAIELLKYKTQQEQSGWFNKAISWVKNTFNLGYNSKKVERILNNSPLTDSSDAKIAFEKCTGEKYSPANIEKFLKGEIKLKSEIYCEKLIGKELSVEEFAAPVLDENWEQDLNEPNTKIKLSKEEKEKYDFIADHLDAEYKNKLENILNSAKLLDNNSNNQSSVLDNLYSILTVEREEGVSAINIVKECLDVLENPCIITQRAEDIPEEYQEQAIDILTNNSKDSIKRNEAKEKLECRSLNTCTAASIEFTLAESNPAEFIRLVNKLTSSKGEAFKTFKFDKNSDEYNAFIENLKLCKTPFEETEDGIVVTLKAGKNTKFLNEIQNNHKNDKERSIIDITIQSLIMNLGSRQTYDALSDTREKNEFTQETEGLISFETSFADNLLNHQNKTSKTYMKVSNNRKITANSIAEKQRDLYNALSENKKILIGYTFTDPETKQINGGHEITIIGYTTNLAGKGFFVCQDSNDEFSHPICMSEEYLLKNIHHAII